MRYETSPKMGIEMGPETGIAVADIVVPSKAHNNVDGIIMGHYESLEVIMHHFGSFEVTLGHFRSLTVISGPSKWAPKWVHQTLLY